MEIILVVDEDRVARWQAQFWPLVSSPLRLRALLDDAGTECSDGPVIVLDARAGGRLCEEVRRWAAGTANGRVLRVGGEAAPSDGAVPDWPLSSCVSAVRRDAGPEEVLAVARLMCRGYTVTPRHQPECGTDGTHLSPRELAVLRHVAAGEGNKAIAHRLGLSEHTVRVHVRSILRKLGISNRTQAAIWLQRRGGGTVPPQSAVMDDAAA